MGNIDEPKLSAINAMSSLCAKIVLQNETESNNNSSNNEITLNIIGSICPNDCNDNGECRNGTCICNDGFVTSDCSMIKGKSFEFLTK